VRGEIGGRESPPYWSWFPLPQIRHHDSRKLQQELLGDRGRKGYHLRNAKVKLTMKDNQEESFEAKCYENVIFRKGPRNLSELHE
jgi:hypothetical protein